jgi:hypothetical protein
VVTDKIGVDDVSKGSCSLVGVSSPVFEGTKFLRLGALRSTRLLC